MEFAWGMWSIQRAIHQEEDGTDEDKVLDRQRTKLTATWEDIRLDELDLNTKALHNTHVKERKPKQTTAKATWQDCKRLTFTHYLSSSNCEVHSCSCGKSPVWINTGDFTYAATDQDRKDDDESRCVSS